MKPLPRFSILLLALAAALVGQAIGQVTWIAPEDGGTPRDSARIRQVGPREFHIRAAFQDGGASALRHAVSRVDLLCRNSGNETATITVHLDLSDDGKRTDYDNRPESGMRLRDFLFIQPPGQDWRQVDGATDRWVATVSFEALPGETKVGLSPWYTYGDYLRFMNGLPKSAVLQPKLLGKSDGGREHWEITLTDPAVPAEKKQRIFWHAREHAYETYSSFAMEGLVEFLLSDQAAEFRRRFLFTIHPMTNPDGVAQGFEYRGGYDFPNPRGTASGRLVFEAIDRLRPDFAVTWHNWVAPRDRDVVFYTDGDHGKPTPRAWHLFAQKFTSPRAVGHRWKDETEPLRYNWQGRALSEANVHQYAMKKFGTQVWGWEMPWWNRSPADARRAGAAFARAFLATQEELRAGKQLPAPELTTPEVPRWEIHEFTLKARARVANPFREAALVGEFTSPSGKTNVIDGFYDGDDTWRLRFAPDEQGEWSYLLRGEGLEAFQRGRLRCTAPRGHGSIRIHPENPYAFAHADGTPFFPMGDTCYGLFDDSPITPELRENYLKTRRAQRFNFVRLTVGHSQPRAAADPAFWAWGGTSQKPDLDRFNPAFFHRFDELVQKLRAGGMNVELILLNFYRAPFTNTRQWTAAREQLWLRYLLARYGAFDHVFLWTIANEYETHPDGKYRLDLPGDVAWVKATARFLKANDPYRHLVTVHPVISASARGTTPRSPFDPPWRIGPFFGAGDELDVLSQQTSAAYAAEWDGRTRQWVRACAADSPEAWSTAAWDEQLNCWTGDAPGVGRSIAADRVYRKPVLNTEFGYEYLRGAPNEGRQVHHTDKVRRTAWRIVCAGGYLAAGFNGTIGHSDAWNRIDPANHYTFEVKDEGAAAQLCALHEFFAGLPFWRMQPYAGVTGQAVALAEIGKVYVAYLPGGGSTTLDLNAAHGPLMARWFNPRTGSFGAIATISGGAQHKFEAPDMNDWVLAATLQLQPVNATAPK
jgi:hypothetical protein